MKAGSPPPFWCHHMVSLGSRNCWISYQCSTSCCLGPMTNWKCPLCRAVWLQASPASSKQPPILAVILLLKTVLVKFQFKTFVNLDKHECTQDFNAHIVQGIKYLGRKLHGIHVRKSIQSMDIDLWTATVPTDKFPEYEGCCLLIKCPAQDYIQRHPKLYHAKMKCPETLTLIGRMPLVFFSHCGAPYSKFLEYKHIANNLCFDRAYSAQLVPIFGFLLAIWLVTSCRWHVIIGAGGATNQLCCQEATLALGSFFLLLP